MFRIVAVAGVSRCHRCGFWLFYIRRRNDGRTKESSTPRPGREQAYKLINWVNVCPILLSWWSRVLYPRLLFGSRAIHSAVWYTFSNLTNEPAGASGSSASVARIRIAVIIRVSSHVPQPNKIDPCNVLSYNSSTQKSRSHIHTLRNNVTHSGLSHS